MTFEDVALSFVPNLGAKGCAHLVDLFGSAREIYALSEQELIDGAGLRADIARAIARRAGFAEAEREMKYCDRNGLSIVAATDEAYPNRLRFTPDRPHILYIKGELEPLCSDHVISIVGTRRMTPYGELMCTRIVESIAQHFPDAVIVSGLAYGIDAAAHRAALAYGLRTVGVLANSLPSVQPVAHRAMAEDMVSKGGALVSELSSQVRQNGAYFIPRNRIVAGLCDGLLVVESPLSGGSLHTAHAADGYSRVVMAVPGRATDTMSQGTNALIGSMMAHMVTNGKQLLDALGWQHDVTDRTVRVEVRDMSAEELKILSCFEGCSDGIPLDKLIEQSGLSAGVVGATLLELELSGVVRCLPGKIYEKLQC